MTYHLARGTVQMGTFQDSELGGAVASGRLRATDLAWCEGMSDWQPLATVMPQLFQTAAIVPAAGLPPALPPMQPYLQQYQQPGPNGLAVTALVLGILSFLCGCLALPAIVFGIVALTQINNSNGRDQGKGLAIAGLICSAVAMVVHFMFGVLNFLLSMAAAGLG